MYNPNEECKIMIDTLKNLCEQKGMKPHALAKKAGISTSTISYIMSGKTKPQIYTILTLCNALEVNLSELFNRDPEVLPEEQAEKEMKTVSSSDEEKMLTCYRCLSDGKKKLLRHYAEMLVQYEDEL